jgi:hypothetical protein
MFGVVFADSDDFAGSTGGEQLVLAGDEGAIAGLTIEPRGCIEQRDGAIDL